MVVQTRTATEGALPSLSGNKLRFLERLFPYGYTGAPHMSVEFLLRWAALGIFFLAAIWFFVNAHRL